MENNWGVTAPIPYGRYGYDIYICVCVYMYMYMYMYVWVREWVSGGWVSYSIIWQTEHRWQFGDVHAAEVMSSPKFLLQDWDLILSERNSGIAAQLTSFDAIFTFASWNLKISNVIWTR